MPRKTPIQFLRGNQANLVTLLPGEPGWCEDTERLYIGHTDEANRLVAGPDRLLLTFGYGDATPESIGTIPAGKLVLTVRLQITVPFDGADPALSIGPSGSAAELMDVTDNDPTQEAAYETNPGVTYGSDTEVFLSITPGSGASAGAGLVLITYQP